MAEVQARTTQGRALQVNLDEKFYGTFAEIGAGQEVARYFFQAGKASQTIAKTISAYDMIYSDEIYGKEKSGRYVCESRLLKMLDKEFSLLQRRLNTHRGDKTCFFAYANTFSTATAGGREPHGWMGIRFQTKPHGPANDIIIHVRMLDRHRLQQQEAIGVLGVNLVSNAFFHRTPNEFIEYLTENIREGQIAFDVLKFSGPDLEKFNTPLMNLELVQRRLADSILFSPSGELLSISDTIFKKSLLIQPGQFKPYSEAQVSCLNKGISTFKKDFGTTPMNLLEIVFEKNSNNDLKELLKRIENINSKGEHVLISNYQYYYQLKNFLSKYSQEPMAILISSAQLEKIFNESYYKNLEGGLLEGLSKLLNDQSKLYVLGDLSFKPSKKTAHIYQQFIENGWIVSV